MTFKGPQQIITNGDMSGDITSMVAVMQQLFTASYAITWSGTAPVGRIAIEVSNDYTENQDGTVRNPGIWNELPLSGPSDVSDDTGHGFIDIEITTGWAMRLVYHRTSGTGTMQVVMMGK